ncbi:MAG: HAD superfamily hydrolase (TIGR01509 family) [Oleispira sp.]|jgi:HAD superfamily hydrolase (TIGR01509 family)
MQTHLSSIPDSNMTDSQVRNSAEKMQPLQTYTMEQWSKIKTVLLDMDGTLLDLHFDNYFWLQFMPAKYAEQYGIGNEEAHQILKQVSEETQGTLSWYCLDYWSERLNMPVAALKQDIVEKIQYRPHVKDFLEMLRQQGKRAVIVTNAHRDSVDLKMARTGLDTLVDRIISSHDYQEPKESQAFWQHLQQNEPFDIDTTLLIDDSQAVLKSAEKWGFKHLLTIFHPDSQKAPNTDSEHPGIHHFDELLHKEERHKPDPLK